MGDDGLMPAVNGTDQRLDLLIGEMRALRALLTPAPPADPRDGETIELREPADDPVAPPAKRKRG